MSKRYLGTVLCIVLTSGAAWSQSGSLSRAGTLSHIAAGGSWDTTIWLINNSSTAINIEMDLHADDGTALSLPLAVTEHGSTQSITTAKLSHDIQSNTALMISAGAGIASTVTGWADILSSGAVSGFAIFRTTCSTCTPSEGTVPLQTAAQAALVVPYDNTQGFVTGVALANLSSTAASITATIWDEFGNRLGAPTIALPASGHTSFVATSTLPVTAANRGIIQFQNSAGNAIDGLGLRFSPYGTFTSVPTVPQAALFQITSVSPASVQAGSSASLVIAGTNLSSVTAVQVSPAAGITISNVSASATQVTATITVAAGTAAGQVNLTVSSAAGVSNALPLAIQTAPPQITSLSPTTAQAGSSISLTINGSNLAGVTAVQVSPSTGITVSNVKATASQVTATLSIASNTIAGQVNISVSSPAGVSNSWAFSISVPPPPYDGHWTGTTSQNLPFSMTVANNTITAYSYGINFPTSLPANCPTGETVTSGPATSITISNGSFSTSTLSGSFYSTASASGSISWSLSLPGCSANGVVSWNARQ